MPALTATVVVVSRNRCDDLMTSLPRHHAAVVLVDNASTDGSPQRVAGLRPDLRVIRLDRNFGAYGRTLGARAADSDLIAFADDDSWWSPDAFERAAALFDAHPRLGLVAGSILVGPGNQPDPLNDVLAASPLPTPPDAPGPELLGFVACGAIVRRSALLAVGGFDDIIRFPGEEERVALDLHDAGWQLCYVPELVAHHHPSSRRDSDEQRQIGIIRSRILTATLRLPWPEVGGEVVSALRTRPGRRGLIGAMRRAPRALRHRRPVGLRTRQARQRLRAADGGVDR